MGDYQANGRPAQSGRSAFGGRSGPGWPGAAEATIGIIANPMSGRDIRRLVARASVFPNAEKTNMVLRLVAAAGVLGVGRVLVSTDSFGISAGVLRAWQRRDAERDRVWPELEFVALDALTGTADDTRETALRMRSAGANVIVLLGGDGTIRAAAPVLGDTPIVPLSTGTNNAFPQMWEATVAGSAAALVAVGAVGLAEATNRAKVLEVESGSRRELALVDVCISTIAHVGARALWHVDSLRELYCAFAEPHAIGLSSVAAMLHPTPRSHPGGVAVRLAGDGPARCWVTAPIAPGVLARVGILEVAPLAIGERRLSTVPTGTVAVDGEREIEFSPDRPVSVTLSGSGPLVVDIPKVMRIASDRDLLLSGQAPAVATSSEPRQRPLDTPAPTHHPDDAPTRR
jgi:predicted polyphosphate/ATP-dependent NAD kinase